MTIKTSGELRMSDISAEFSGGAQTTKLSNYFKGAGYVAEYLIEPNGIPSNGYIAFSDFYGAGAGYDSGTFPVLAQGTTTHQLPVNNNKFGILYVIHYGGWAGFGYVVDMGSISVRGTDNSSIVLMQETKYAAPITGVPNRLVYSVDPVTNLETLITAITDQEQAPHYTILELHNFPNIGSVQSIGNGLNVENPTSFVNMRVTNLTTRSALIAAHNPTHYYKIVIL